LQALALLNDPVFYECAQTLGQQIYEQHPNDLSAAIDNIYLRCLGRQPTEQERGVLTAAYQDVLRLKEGEVPQVKQDEAPNVAALIAVTRVVMNLDEFITRD
jgi:hypothetical protein